MPTAKVFWSGRSQAVRLPKEFRFDTGSAYPAAWSGGHSRTNPRTLGLVGRDHH